MIELNLLPKELRKKKKRPVQMPEIPVLPVAAGAMVFFVSVHLLVLFMAGSKKSLLKSAEEKWDQMRPQREKTEKIVKGIASLEKKVIAVRKIAKPDLAWAKLLSGLSQAVIPNIWLSDFELKFSGTGAKRKAPTDLPFSLDITGYALGRSEEATLLVAKFINSLKRNKDFSGYFEEIELQNMRNREVAGEEAMMFKLECRFKEIESVGTAGRRKSGGGKTK
ncbi:MAG: hypothetical protein DRP85_01170 [Candidatus Makaraimicrobium thalassicum]|nr:MAG: hypothetical protein DRP85_01170 [Candidatus Omnitrophota bacterium]